MNEKIIAVSFKDSYETEYGSKEYHFKCNIEVKEGDFVVVETKFGFSLAKVTKTEIARVSRNVKLQDLKQVVNVVDFTAFNERIHKQERMAELKKLMDAKVKEMQELAIYESLCSNDDTFKDLLSEFKNLMGGE